MGYVLSHAVNGRRTEEVFYKNSCCDEAGFDLEIVLFGGYVLPVELEEYTGHICQEVALISHAYPSKELVDNYRDFSNETISQRWEGDDWTLKTRLPLSFAASMFMETFWTHDIPRMVGHIQPTTRVSWFTKVVQAGDEFVDGDGALRVFEEGEKEKVVTSALESNMSEQVREDFQKNIMARLEHRKASGEEKRQDFEEE